MVYVSDCVMLGEVSLWLIRFTSPAPYARGSNHFLIGRPMGPSVEVAEVACPGTSPQAIMSAPARWFSCLSMPFSRIVEQSNPTGTKGSEELVIILPLVIACRAL